MRDNLLLQQLREAIRSLDEESPEEWFAEMQRRGVLDAEGNVLLRMPEPADAEDMNGQAASGRRAASRKRSATASRKKKKKAP